MQELLEWMDYIEDTRQQTKVRHTLKDILVIMLFATLANADDRVEMALCHGDDIALNYATALWKIQHYWLTLSASHRKIKLSVSFVCLQKIQQERSRL